MKANFPDTGWHVNLPQSTVKASHIHPTSLEGPMTGSNRPNNFCHHCFAERQCVLCSERGWTTTTCRGLLPVSTARCNHLKLDGVLCTSSPADGRLLLLLIVVITKLFLFVCFVLFCFVNLAKLIGKRDGWKLTSGQKGVLHLCCRSPLYFPLWACVQVLKWQCVC